ncbi:MAG TPA: hypothetical protein VGN26_05150 [Armatimonadota bacterium]|jgi:hypothetical protein
MAERFVGIQVGAVSFVDEGVEPVLDVLKERAGVNALLLATPTWTRGTGGRQIPGVPLPDHGAQEYDLDWLGGSYTAVHERYFPDPRLARGLRAREHGDWDLFEEVVPSARARGLRTYAWMEESAYGPQPRLIDGWASMGEQDVLGRKVQTPCMRNPAYVAWWGAIIEDYLRSHPIDGVVWCSEKGGPLTRVLNGSRGNFGDSKVTCFCPHCREAARERGVDPEKARAGLLKLLEWQRAAAEGQRPPDGHFVSLWRILLSYPEVLAWDKLWADGQHQMLREMWGTVKAIDSKRQFGFHLCHMVSWSPFYRATEDLAEMSQYCDLLKLVTYNNCAGPRYHGYQQSLNRAFLADCSPEDTYPVMMDLLGYAEDEASTFAELPTKGFGADYVRRETERAVAQAREGCLVCPGIDIDIPTGEGQSQCSREGVRDAVLAAFQGGAHGVVLSRKYSEMRLDNLSGAGDAIRELGSAG